MLPDIRAVIAAIVAAAGLLMVSFGLVATFRVAQEHHTGSLQADLAKRGRPVLPDPPLQRAVLIIDTPGPHLAPKAAPEPSAVPVPEPASAAPEAAFPTEPVPIVQVEAAPIAALAAASPEASAPPPAEPPIGGPFTPPPIAQAEAAGKADKIAPEKARKARTARERKAKRAAQVHLAKERPAPANQFGGGNFGTNQFGNTVNQLGGTFRQ